MWRAIILAAFVVALISDSAAAGRRTQGHHAYAKLHVTIPVKRSERVFYQKNLNFSDLTELLPEAGLGVIPLYGIGVGFCVFGNMWLGAILTALVQHRELEPHEAVEIIAACFLPVIGRTVARYFLKRNPGYDDFVRRTYPRYNYNHQLAIY